MTSHHNSYASSGKGDNYFVRIWDENVRGILFGVLYTMTKENTLPNVFVLASLVLEFLQLIMFSFRPDYYWGGLTVDTQKVNISIVGYHTFVIIFWLVVALLILGIANGLYVGYAFHQGELASIHLLRTLRWICSLLVSVLFIPILSVLLAGVACNYGASPPKLVLFPTHECWGSSHIAIGLIAIVLLIFFSIFSLFTGLTYYEFDPSIVSASGRLQNRFEFGALWVKMLLVFVNYFFTSHPIVFAVVLLASAVALFITWVVMLPAYDRKLNMARAGSFLGVLWVTISMFISLDIRNARSYLSIIILVVGLPFSIALGAFIADRRLKFLCNPQLVDGFIDSEEIPAKPVKKSSSRVVKWETARPNKLLRNKLYTRLIFPTDVEIATRFALTAKPNQMLIEKAKAVYMTGMSKFPDSPTVLQAYVNFIFTVVGDMQLGYITLEKLRKMKPYVDIQFFIYRYDKDREQRSDGGKDMVGDFVSYLEYKKLHQSAKRYHSAAAVSMRKFWRYLMESQVDVLELSEMSSNIATSQKKAADSYTRLLQHHPKNVRILRDYARFLDEIVNDEHSAQEIWNKADKYETQEMEKITDSHRSVTREAPPIDTNDSNSSYKDDPASEHSSESEHTASSLSSGFGAGVATQRKERHHRLNVLGWVMFFTTLFALVVTFTQLGVLTSELGNYERVVEVLDASGAMSQQMGKMGIEVMDGYYLSIYNVTGGPSTLPWIGDYSTAMYSARKSTYVFENIVKSIYWGTSDPEPFTTPGRRELKMQNGFHIDRDISQGNLDEDQFDGKTANKAKIQKFFNAPIINVTFMSGTTGGVAHLLDMWTLSMLVGGSMEEFTEADILDLAYGNPVLVADANLLLVNIYEMFNAAALFLDLCSDLVALKLNSLFIICIIMLAVSLAALMIAALTIFRPIVNTIYDNKVKTIYMFTLIPPHVVKHMAKKKISTLGGVGDSDTDITDDEYMKTEKVISKTRNEPQPSDTNVEHMVVLEATPPGPLHEIVHTPRGSEVLRTPRGSEVARTPRGDTENQKQTLLLPNTIEEEPEGDYEAGMFKDLRSSAEMRVTQVIADKILVGKEGTAGRSSHKPKKSDKKSRKKRHSRTSSRDIEMQVRGESSNNNNSHNEQMGERFNAPKVPSFKEKASLSIIPSFNPFHRRTSDVPLPHHHPLSLPGPPPKGTESDDDSDTSTSESEKRLVKKGSKKHGKPPKREFGNRLTVASLRGVVVKIHLQYLLAILLFCLALGISFVITYEFVGNLESIANNIKVSDLRTQNVMLLILQATIFPLGPTASIPSAVLFKGTLNDVWTFNNQMDPRSYQQEYLFGRECLRINKSECPDETYQYYETVKYGFSHLFFDFLALGSDMTDKMLLNNGTLDPNDPMYIKFRSLATHDLYDGLDTVTFLVYMDAKHQITSAKQRIAISTVVTSVLFVLIHIILFRPFVKKLRAESEHTFAILHMIPRRLLQEVPEIQAFLREEAGELA